MLGFGRAALHCSIGIIRTLGLGILCSGALVVLLMVAVTQTFSLRETVRETLAYE